MLDLSKYAKDKDSYIVRLEIDELFETEQILENQFADIVVDISELSYSEIIDRTVSDLDKCGKL